MMNVDERQIKKKSNSWLFEILTHESSANQKTPQIGV